MTEKGFGVAQRVCDVAEKGLGVDWETIWAMKKVGDVNMKVREIIAASKT